MNRSHLATALTKLAFLAGTPGQGERAAQVLDEVSQSIRDGVRHSVPPHWTDYQKKTYTQFMDSLEGGL